VLVKVTNYYNCYNYHSTKAADRFMIKSVTVNEMWELCGGCTCSMGVVWWLHISMGVVWWLHMQYGSCLVAAHAVWESAMS
jgi:hypothetical protein